MKNKKMVENLAIILLIVLGLGALGLNSSSNDGFSISNDIESIDYDLVVGLPKKSGHGFEKDDFTNAIWKGYQDDDYYCSGDIEIIDNKIDFQPIFDTIESVVYEVENSHLTTHYRVDICFENPINCNNIVMNVHCVENVYFSGNGDYFYTMDWYNGEDDYYLNFNEEFGSFIDEIDCISFSWSDVRMLDDSYVYIEPLDGFYSSLNFNLYSNNKVVDYMTLDATSSLFFEDDKYPNYVFYDLKPMLKEKYISNYERWYKRNENYITIKILNGKTYALSSSYTLTKNGLYIFNLPYENNDVLTPEWSDIYD